MLDLDGMLLFSNSAIEHDFSTKLFFSICDPIIPVALAKKLQIFFESFLFFFY